MALLLVSVGTLTFGYFFFICNDWLADDSGLKLKLGSIGLVCKFENNDCGINWTKFFPIIIFSLLASLYIPVILG